MTTFKEWYIFLGTVALTLAEIAFASELQQHLEPRRIQPGERATFVVSLTLPGLTDAEDELPEIQDALLTQAFPIQILRQEFLKIRDTFFWKYEITSHRLGDFTLPPVEVKYKADSYSSQSIALEVFSYRQSGDNQLRPEAGLLNFPFPWRRLLAALSACLFLGLAYALFRRKVLRTTRVAVARHPKEPPAPVWLKEQLRLMKERVSTPNESLGAEVDALARTIREYFFRRDGLSTLAWTTSQFRRKEGTLLTAGLILSTLDAERFTGRPSAPSPDFLLSKIQEAEGLAA